MAVDDLPENTLVSDIKELETQAQELKNRQFVSGAYNVISYKNESANTWDYDMTLGTLGDPSGYQHTFGIFFYTEKKYAFGTPYMEMFIDGTADSNRLTQDNPVFVGVNGTAVLDTYCDYIITYFGNTAGQFGWVTRVTVFGQINFKVKYYVVSPNKGDVLKGYTAP